MKLFFRITFNIFLILTISIGCKTTEKIKKTDPVALLNQGIAFGEKGQYDRSIDCFNKALDIKPRYAGAYNNRGVVYYKKGLYDKAISDFTKAIEINPNDAAPYNARGFVYMVILGNKTKACSDWKRACELGLCENYERAKRKGNCKQTSGPLRVWIR